MRKILPIVLTLLGLVACFLLYLHNQPKLQAVTPHHWEAVNVANLPAPSGSFMGPGSDGWVRHFDQVTGKLSYQFKVAEFESQSDGTVRVTRPVIEVFQPDGQLVRIEGDDGVVTITPGEERTIFSGAPASPPRYGTLHNVIVKVYKTAEQMARNANDPDLTLTMANAKFDNDTYRLFTQEYVDGANHVIRADEIPVTLHSRDYDFEGNGLNLYWNAVDQRLKSLEIAHGRQLTIHHAKQFSRDTMTLDAMGVETQPPVVASGGATPSHEPPLSTPPAVAGNAPGPDAPPRPSAQKPAPDSPVASPSPILAASRSSATTTPSAQQRFLATFYDDVQILQADHELARGRKMDFDFSSKGEGGDPIVQNQPASPKKEPVNQGQPASPPIRVGAVANNDSVSPKEPPATPASNAQPPATAPAENKTAGSALTDDQSIEVKWSGKMRMVPVDAAQAGPLEPGQSTLTLVGEPVVIHQASTPTAPAAVIQCAELNYSSADSILHLRGTDLHRMVITQTQDNGDASVVSARALHYDLGRKVALLQGEGYASFPDPADPRGILHASWDESCTVNFTSQADSAMQIQLARLVGNVKIDHPRFSLQSGALDLDFEPMKMLVNQSSSAVPQLTQITARHDVHCLTFGSDKQAIDSQFLRIQTARGEKGALYAHLIEADDRVHAVQKNQTLDSGHLAVLLRPVSPDAATALNASPGHRLPASSQRSVSLASDDVELESLTATDKVQVTREDGLAMGDRLVVTTVDGHPHVTLEGKEALVVSKEYTLTGQQIFMWPDDSWSKVNGPGSLRGLQKSDDPHKEGRKIAVTWQTEAIVNGSKNQINVEGKVDAQSSSMDGDSYLAKGEHLLIHLEAVPKSSTSSPATKPADHNDYDFMHDTRIKSLALQDVDQKAQIEGRWIDPATKFLLRETSLWGDEIDYDWISQDVTVPGPGKMWIEEHKPDAQPQRSTPTVAGNVTPTGSSKFQWDKRLEYSNLTHRAVIQGTRGGVRIAHVDDGSQQPMALFADTVVADFEQTRDTPKPSDVARRGRGQPPQPVHDATGNASDAGVHLTLGHLAASGTVVTIQMSAMTPAQTTITCQSVDFDPQSGLLTCGGGDSVVMITGEHYPHGQTFGMAVLDVHRNQLVKVTNVSGKGR